MTNSPSLPSLHGESKKILSQKAFREAAIKGCLGPASPTLPGAVRRARMWCGIPLELTHHMFLRWCSMEPEGGHNASPFLKRVEGFQRFNRLPRGDEWRGSHIPCIIRAAHSPPTPFWKSLYIWYSWSRFKNRDGGGMVLSSRLPREKVCGKPLPGELEILRRK